MKRIFGILACCMILAACNSVQPEPEPLDLPPILPTPSLSEVSPLTKDDIFCLEKRETYYVSDPDAYIDSLAINSDGSLIATGLSTRDIQLWNTQTGQLHVLSGHEGRVISLAFSPNRNLLISGDDEGVLYFWDVDNTQQIWNGEFDSTYNINKIIFDETGERLIFASDSKIISLTVVRPWHQITYTNKRIKILNAALLSEERIIFNTDYPPSALERLGSEITIVDMNTRETVIIYQEYTPILASNPTNDLLAILEHDYLDQIVKLRNFTNNKDYILIGHQRKITNMDFSSNGDLLATSSLDGTLRLWDTTTGEQLAAIGELLTVLYPDSQKNPYFVRFDPVNPALIISYGDTFEIWALCEQP